MTDPHGASSIFPSFPRPFVTISTRPALLRACERTTPGKNAAFTILSPLHAGAGLGLDWWRALVKDCPCPSVLDCGANAALALAALHVGIEGVICRDFRAGLPDSLRGRLFPARPPETGLEQFLHCN